MNAFHLLAAASSAAPNITEAEHHTGVFPPFDPTYFPSQLFWLAISFGLLLVLLSRVLLPRLGSIIEERSDKIADDIDRAARMQREAELAEKSYEKELSDAKAKAHNVAESTRASVNAEIEAELEVADRRSDEALAIADTKIKAMRDQALANVDGIAQSAVPEILSKLYGGKVTAQAAKKAVSQVN